MRSATTFALTILLSFVPPSVFTAHGSGQALSEEDLSILRVCEGVTELFDQEAAAIWPGYSLAEQPFIVYVPDEWALLLNATGKTEGFGLPPSAWPDLGPRVRYHEGKYGTLVGQLAFDVSVGETTAVALGLPRGFSERTDRPVVKAFKYIVHEAFHQYQHDAFGEMPWEREERYPITDLDNAALAWMEMRILEDALEALEAGDLGACRRRALAFVAVRRHRWNEVVPFVRRYEQYKELSEGTAKYVELRCLELLPKLQYESALDGSASPVAESFTRAPMSGLLLEELRGRMGEGCLSPEDIPRNRIYSVASAQAFLLDHFGIEWKKQAAGAGPDFTYVELLENHLGVMDDAVARLAEDARSEYAFDAVLASAAEAQAAYRQAYASELASFENQEGSRVEVAAPSTGLSRSRVSGAKKWLSESGRYCLCSRFEVYTLKTGDWMLELHDVGVLEINDWDAGSKEVVFYDPRVSAVSIDGAPALPATPGVRDFDSIEVTGDHFSLRSQVPGRLDVSEDTIRLDF